jgi:hypothetical protein
MMGIRLFCNVVAVTVLAGAVVSQEERLKKAPRNAGSFLAFTRG